MSHGDPSQAELRSAVGLEPEPTLIGAPPVGFIADVNMSLPSVDRVGIVIPDTPPFSAQQVEEMAQALYAQGNYFMGRDVRFPDNARKVARDLLIILEVMKYESPTPKPDGPLKITYNEDGSNWPWDNSAPAVGPATGVVPGTPGHFTPVGCDLPADLMALRVAGDLGQTTKWSEGNWVELADASQVTYISVPNFESPWVLGPVSRENVKINDNFAAEPTVTASDAANAAKLGPLGYVASGGGAWASWDLFYVGPWGFTWDGAAWAAG